MSTSQRPSDHATTKAAEQPAPGAPPVFSVSSGFDFAALDHYLPLAFPPALVQLAHALLEPVPDFSAIGGCLSLDPVLAGCALRLARSAAPDSGARADFSHLAALLGVKPLLDLVLSYPLRLRFFRKAPPEAEQLFDNWRATLLAAITAEELALRLAPDLTEEAYRTVLFGGLAQSLARTTDASGVMTRDERLFARLVRSLAADLELPAGAAEAILAGRACLERENTPELCRIAAAAALLSEAAAAPDSPLSRQARDVLRGKLELNGFDLDSLLNRCRIRLDTLLRHLGVGNAYTTSAPYTAALSLMHSLSSLAASLRPEQGGLPLLAARFSEQAHGYWGITDWELALRLPGSPLCLFFRSVSGEPPEEQGPLLSSELPWSFAGSARYTLAAGSAQRGTLRLPPPRPEQAESFSLYLRFVSLALETYHGISVPRECQAESFAGLPQAVARFDAEGYFLDANARFLALFALPAPPLHTTVFSLFEHRFSLDLEGLWQGLAASPSGMLRTLVAGPVADAADSFLELQLHSIKNGREYLLLLSEAADLDKAQRELLREKELQDLIFRTMPELVFTLDDTGRIVWVSGQRQDLAGKNLFSLAQPASSFFQGVWEPAFLAGLTQPRLVEISFLGDEAGLSLFELSLTPMDSRSGHSFLAVARDLNIPRRLDERVRHQVTHDGLTGLFSHSQCQVLLEAEEEKSRRRNSSLGIIAFDIHNFYLYNTMYGYQTGDMILRRVAAGINATLRQGEDMAFRYGGDEFVVLAPGVSAEKLEDMGRAICRLVRSSCGEAVELCCGLVLCGPEDASFRRLLAAAVAVSALPGQILGEPVWANT